MAMHTPSEQASLDHSPHRPNIATHHTHPTSTPSAPLCPRPLPPCPMSSASTPCPLTPVQIPPSKLTLSSLPCCVWLRVTPLVDVRWYCQQRSKERCCLDSNPFRLLWTFSALAAWTALAALALHLSQGQRTRGTCRGALDMGLDTLGWPGWKQLDAGCEGCGGGGAWGAWSSSEQLALLVLLALVGATTTRESRARAWAMSRPSSILQAWL